MDIALVEYRIREESRTAFKDWALAVFPIEEMELYEGADQPGLFVESWRGKAVDTFEEWKKERQDSSHPLWSPLHAWIDGGAAKLHIWRFNRVER